MFYKYRKLIKLSVIAPLAILVLAPTSAHAALFDHFEWIEVNSGTGITWEGRAGLQAIKLRGKFYVMGGRSPKIVPATFGDSNFYNDVWQSDDSGDTWNRVTDGNGAPWAARAYFQAVRKGRHMYILGGQDSTAIPNPDPTCGGLVPPNLCPDTILASNFYNDVWRSTDGETWHQMTAEAAWSGRAGLSAVSHRGWIYVMGGSFNDDSAIIGPGGPPRIYFNDVYRSRNGQHWQRMTEAAPWEPRAGAVVVSRGHYLYLLRR